MNSNASATESPRPIVPSVNCPSGGNSGLPTLPRCLLGGRQTLHHDSDSKNPDHRRRPFGRNGCDSERNGYEVAIETDSHNLLESLHNSPRPDLLLADSRLSFLSGRAILDIRKSDREISDIPLIVISGEFTAKIPDRVPVLAKPVSVPVLLKLVATLCTRTTAQHF